MFTSLFQRAVALVLGIGAVHSSQAADFTLRKCNPVLAALDDAVFGWLVCHDASRRWHGDLEGVERNRLTHRNGERRQLEVARSDAAVPIQARVPRRSRQRSASVGAVR